MTDRTGRTRRTGQGLLCYALFHGYALPCPVMFRHDIPATPHRDTREI
ncbi:hypothetical protein [Novacetimonas hansenii]|uniref:Uncharacterized protein n=1 Tax=Novacetimonas hansenii TaxID=436 RepID=A0AAW5EV68_NOVHA|nr:hypothetical protein [Novacetimonas hansenii]MCJ8354220.1 hypothetical protein [Novacetimonas hansenii]